MPSKLPDNMRSLVIQEWLRGERRDKIAGDNGLSAGAVTNIINEWKLELGFAIADALRELALTLNKIGITPAQCAHGFRIAMMMNKLGVKEDSYESFMIDVYNRCKNLGLTPENIATYLTDLFEFSKTMPFSQISDFLQKKVDEKEKLKSETGKLYYEKSALEHKVSELQGRHTSALEEERITHDNLKWYSDLKVELGKYGIPVDDISKLASVVRGISQSGYNANKIVNEYLNLESARVEYNSYVEVIPRLKNQCNVLNQEYSQLQQMVTSCKELYAMGFGLKELKALWHTIREIALANNLDLDNAVQKFFKDINNQYDDKLGFEAKVDMLRAEVNRLNQQEGKVHTELLTLPFVGHTLLRIIQSGVKEQDIIDIAELLKNDTSFVTSEERQSSVDEIRKYGGVKSTIKQLNKQIDELRKDMVSLETQKQDLNTQNQIATSSLIDSKKIIEFLSGYADSLRNEIVRLVSIIAYSMKLLNILFEGSQKQKLEDTDLRERFVPLIRAARDNQVSLAELKLAGMEVIDIILGKLNSDDKAKETLIQARTALMNKED